MSEVWQRPEKYSEQFSEQAKQTAEWSSPWIPISRARCVAGMLAAAEVIIGKRGGPGLQARVQSILDNAREHKVSPATYEVAYFISRTIKPEHVTIRNEVTP